jgi:hypothetical protein
MRGNLPDWFLIASVTLGRGDHILALGAGDNGTRRSRTVSLVNASPALRPASGHNANWTLRNRAARAL